jgi:MFS family permease
MRLIKHNLGSNFNKLWLGESFSMMGSSITEFALPLTAAQTLNATPSQMGFLSAIAWLPMLVMGLFVGVWVDRRQRRPVLIYSNVLRAIVLAVIPIAVLGGWLSLPLLLVVALLHGALGVFFVIAYPSYLPALVGREHVTEGNAKLEMSSSVAQIAGPSLAGLLARLISAPFTIAFDVVSFLISAFFLSRIDKPEPAPQHNANGTVYSNIAEGMAFILHRPILRALVTLGILSNINGGITSAVLLLFALNELQLDSAQVGIAMSAMGPGAIIGAALAANVAKHIGMARAVLLGLIMCIISYTYLPFVFGLGWLAVAQIALMNFVFGIGGTIWNINVISMRQMITPHHLLGRVNASVRTLVLGVMPIGALIGGWLGELVGLRNTLLIAAVIIVAVGIYAVANPYLRNNIIPKAEDN